MKHKVREMLNESPRVIHRYYTRKYFVVNASILDIYLPYYLFHIDLNPCNYCPVKGKLSILFLYTAIYIYLLRTLWSARTVYSPRSFAPLKYTNVLIASYRTLTRSLSLPCVFNYEVLDHEDM